jgi:hypothetical protein
MRCSTGGGTSNVPQRATIRLPDESGWFRVSSSTPTSSRGCGTLALVEEFFGNHWPVKGRKQSTVRGYQYALRLFCSYVSDPDYGWDWVCEQRFGTHPARHGTRTLARSSIVAARVPNTMASPANISTLRPSLYDPTDCRAMGLARSRGSQSMVKTARITSPFNRSCVALLTSSSG